MNVRCELGRESWAADVRPGEQSPFKPHWVEVDVHRFSEGGVYKGRISCDAADEEKADLSDSSWLYWFPVHDCRHFATRSIRRMLGMCP